MRKLSFVFLIIFTFSAMIAQNNYFKQNYELAKQLYDSDIIEQVVAKPLKISNDLKTAFLLAEYYKCANENEAISIDEMKIAISIYYGDFSWRQKDDTLVETEYFKMINKLDKELHQKSFLYLKDFVLFH